MKTVRSTATVWTARLGVGCAVAAATLVSIGNPALAAPVTATASPANGSSDQYLSLTTTTANTFMTGSTSNIGDATSVQFSATACPTVTGTVPAARVGSADAALVTTARTVTSTSLAFTATDVGKIVTVSGGTGTLPANTYIVSVASGTATLSANPTGAGTAALTVTPVSAASATPVSGTKLVIKTPTNLPTSATGIQWSICVWNKIAGGANADVLSTTNWKSYAAPTISTVSNLSGPSLGGNSITITGTGFGTATNTSATIGGVALRNPTVTSTTITGTVPSNTAASGPIVVTTDGGSVTYKVASTVAPYTYIDSLSVTPKVMTRKGSVVLDIFGTGFQTLDFASGVASANDDSHIIIAPGLSTVASNSLGNVAAECTAVTVLSDNELICTLNGLGALNPSYNASTGLPAGAYHLQLINDVATGTTTLRTTELSSDSTFTIASF